MSDAAAIEPAAKIAALEDEIGNLDAEIRRLERDAAATAAIRKITALEEEIENLNDEIQRLEIDAAAGRPGEDAEALTGRC